MGFCARPASTNCRSFGTCSRAKCRWSGPRPLPCDESDGCQVWQRSRLDATPGLTCIWQVRGAVAGNLQRLGPDGFGIYSAALAVAGRENLVSHSAGGSAAARGTMNSEPGTGPRNEPQASPAATAIACALLPSGNGLRAGHRLAPRAAGRPANIRPGCCATKASIGRASSSTCNSHGPIENLHFVFVPPSRWEKLLRRVPGAYFCSAKFVASPGVQDRSPLARETAIRFGASGDT